MMQQVVDAFALGPVEASSELRSDPRWPVSLRVTATGLSTVAEFARSPYARQFSESDCELVALLPEMSPDSLRMGAILAFSLASGQAAAVSLERIDPDLRADPTWTPELSDCRVLYAARSSLGPAVLRVSKLRQIGPIRPVSEPVWDWLIRAVLSGERVHVQQALDKSQLNASRLPLLAPPRPGKTSAWISEHLSAVSTARMSRGPASQPLTKFDEIAIRAGLFQWHDLLDESHELSQSIEGQGDNLLGDYWHAIMHRREPDYSNAKYWFRRVGNQPTYRDLRARADAVLADCPDKRSAIWRDRLQAGSKWNPLAFVDLCEECAADEQSDLAIAARRIQYAEMSLLV